MMGNSSGTRARQPSGLGKGSSKAVSHSVIDPRRSARTSLASAAVRPLSPPTSTKSDPELYPPNTVRHDLVAQSSEDIAPEIIVWTEDMDTVMGDQSEPVSPSRVSTPAITAVSVPEEQSMAPLPPPPPPAAPTTPSSSLHLMATAKEMSAQSSSLSSLSSLSEPSDLSSIPSGSSKATTPVDVDSSREAPAPGVTRVSQSTTSPRRKWDVRPKVSIPPDVAPSEYALQCITAAEASRLNPYALHQEEYLMLRDHISHAQVTTYLNIRNGILRLWVRNPQIPVTREEAVGCAKDARWFDSASVCFDWLIRRGYINFGCVEVRSSRKHANKDAAEGRRKTVVVIGAGMSGLGCARQLEGLFAQYHKKFRRMGEEPPRVVVLEGRNRIGGRVYSRAFRTMPKQIPEQFRGRRFTAEMGGMIITGFDRGNPLNILVRAQLGLAYHLLRPETTLYDSNGKPVDLHRDQLVEKLHNDCLDRVSEYKFKPPTSKLIEGNRDLIDEGRDSSADTHKTIRQAEELAAAQPHAPSVSEQNIAPQVNLVPVSTDRATGKIHTEPGMPGALKAAHKAKILGWTLKQGVSDEADLDVESATRESGATFGSVMDKVFAQYRDFVDLTAQDFRLMNWHVANLEYSNATNYHQLSLQGWDIDAGNEWEGSHSMVVGGYQSVPRGLMHLPTPLDVRQQSPVSKITYTSDSTTGPAVVTCEDGTAVEADYVVSTIPLGVLKHGNVSFEPPLPSWKTEAIDRLGFGVLNKVILVYKEPFWDESRDIFGVLRSPTNRNSLDQKDYASKRGRFFQWFNITKTSGLPVLLALMAGDAGFDTEQTCNDDLVAEATEILRSVYGSRVPHPVEAVVTRWASDKFARGSYSSAGPDMKADDYDAMARPVGNLFFAGEHTSGTHPATVHGAYLSGLRAASEVVDALLGPISIPTPLVLPRDYFSSSSSHLKRKAAASLSEADLLQARLDAWETALWDHVVARLGPRPLPPAKPATNAYIFYSKAHYEDARRRLEVVRGGSNNNAGNGNGSARRGGKSSANEVRVMSARMWRDAGEEERKPYVEMAEARKREYVEALERWKAEVERWDGEAKAVREGWETENPPPAPSGSGLASGIGAGVGGVGGGGGEVVGAGTTRKSKLKVESYAEADTGDEAEEEEMEGVEETG